MNNNANVRSKRASNIVFVNPDYMIDNDVFNEVVVPFINDRTKDIPKEAILYASSSGSEEEITNE